MPDRRRLEAYARRRLAADETWKLIVLLWLCEAGPATAEQAVDYLTENGWCLPELMRVASCMGRLPQNTGGYVRRRAAYLGPRCHRSSYYIPPEHQPEVREVINDALAIRARLRQKYG